MAIDATARTANVRSRIEDYIAGLTITGSPTYLPEGVPRSTARPSPWLRVSIDIGQGEDSGEHAAGVKAYRTPVTVTIEVMFPDGDDGRAYNMRDVDKAADDVADAFRLHSLPFLDYSVDPGAPTSVTGAPIRFFRALAPARLPPADGYVRRLVVAEGEWFMRHTL